ncbi:MAG: tRNA pseudouridine(38-40) synthase TruA [Candidatus Merdivicinus sp.]|jgi:tRNA pseudouridine38-40 synthase
MRKLLFEIAYQGRNYHGYQVQENARTVAETLQDAIEMVWKKREDIVGCSRTDAGVHANQYFFHMVTEHTIPVKAAVIALNNMLPDDIAVLSCREVPMDFHARYSVSAKEYLYKIWDAPVRNPFLDGLALHYRHRLNEGLLHQCAQEFLGGHDFIGFCSAGGKTHDTFRHIYETSVTRQGDLVEFRVKGDGFLYNMVRIMVGTLLLADLGKLQQGDITRILAAKDRTAAGITASPAGLYLNRVFYPAESLTGGCCEKESTKI